MRRKESELVALAFLVSYVSFFLSQEWGLIDLLLRASNEGLLRPRVARAQEINSLHSAPCLDYTVSYAASS